MGGESQRSLFNTLNSIKMSDIELNSEERESSNGTYSTGYESKLSSSQLTNLFEDELKDVFWAEMAITKAMPKMIDNSRNPELRDAIRSHQADTVNQVIRIQKIFEELGKQALAQKCDAMEGLLKEADVIMEECEEGTMRDVGIISAAQKVEHYEIATYGTLRQMAESLHLDHAVELIQTTLDEEKAADEKLTEIAVKLTKIQNINSN
jgi:ferritin-like metal-binding protein YciE